MYVVRQGTRIGVSAPAKLNLFLELHERRTDGFHELDTLMVPVSLFDSLSLEPRTDKTINLACRWATGYDKAIGSDLPAAVDNLVYRAIRELQIRSGTNQGADISLVKRIPSQAGMGGGSSDAMAALVAANEAWQLGWNRNALMELGAELGSDVPFFAEGRLARCTGRGEKIQPIKTTGRMHFVVVKPAEGLSTPEVFRRTTVPKEPTASAPLLAAIKQMNLRSVGDLLFNRLEIAANTITSWIEEVRQVMDSLSTLGHQMSGSGTSYYALCRNNKHARHLAARLRATQLGQVFVVASLGMNPSL